MLPLYCFELPNRFDVYCLFVPQKSQKIVLLQLVRCIEASLWVKFTFLFWKLFLLSLDTRCILSLLGLLLLIFFLFLHEVFL